MRYRDNSTAILLITLVVTLLSTASTDAEKLILYRLLADTSIEMPEVITMASVSFYNLFRELKPFFSLATTR